MADFTSSPYAGAQSYESDTDYSTAQGGNAFTKLTNAAGAVVSLALIAGIGVWGYQLFVRDVSGIPVVRAAAGEMRVRPEEPGGQLSQNGGLSVNVVAAEGATGRPADSLRLAPRPVDLTDEDRITPAVQTVDTTDADASDVTEQAQFTTVSAALQSGNVDDLVARLTDGVDPIAPADEADDLDTAADTEADIESDIQADVNAAVTAAVEALENAEPLEEVKVAALDAPGVRNSLRPRRRPAGSVPTPILASLNTAAPVSAAPVTQEVDASDLPVGTRLAQLGAFDSPEVAREQWDQLQGRFGAYLQDKQRVIQQASSGGRVFYRLRAHGFTDIADARRFCSALVADNADCIPVVTR